jgi:3-hydroxyisobutyrate dehydrogenase-like beta-hydroxyacid dehydrogenase
VVDAPVSGGSKGAEAATLAIMASGSDDALDRVAPVLSRLGHLTVVGPHAGQGQAVKLANQVMMAAAMAGTVEGLQVAARHGVGEARVRDVVGRGTGASWVLENWEWMSRLWEEYEPGKRPRRPPQGHARAARRLRRRLGAAARHRRRVPAPARTLDEPRRGEAGVILKS